MDGENSIFPKLKKLGSSMGNSLMESLMGQEISNFGTGKNIAEPSFGEKWQAKGS